MRSARSSFLIKILTAIFCLAACLELATAQAAPAGKATLVVGKVEVAAPGAKRFSALKRGQTIAVGSTVRTGKGARVVVVSGTNTVTRIGPKSVVVFRENTITAPESGTPAGQKIRTDIKSGSMSALIEKGKRRKTDFRISTPHGGAAARGTVYGVAVKDGRTYVRVREGKVAIDAAGPREKKPRRRPARRKGPKLIKGL